MSTETVLAAVAGGLIGGALVALVGLVLLRLTRSSRDLGTDADRARHDTLRLAALAAGELAGGLHAGGAERAARHLRAVLGCRAFGIVDDAGEVLAWDSVDGLSPDAQLVARVRETAESAIAGGRTRLDRAAGSGDDVVAAPIAVSGRAAGAVVAAHARPGGAMVRATGAVAGWIAAQLETAQLDASRAALAEAEVRALRAQISPHFIYNALNAVASFVLTDPARAHELLLEFADFTRYSFRKHGEFTTLDEELRSIDSYLRLERARFGERIEVALQIAPELLGTIIPFLSVQPLVENAVRHGLEGRERGGRVTITARDIGSHAEIRVEDDGVGFDHADLAALFATRGAEHVGLRNVDARLRQVYGDEHGLVVDSGPGVGTLVIMRIPKSQPGRVVDGAGAA